MAEPLAIRSDTHGHCYKAHGALFLAQADYRHIMLSGGFDLDWQGMQRGLVDLGIRALGELAVVVGWESSWGQCSPIASAQLQFCKRS